MRHHLWKREKIPEMNTNGYSDEWWTTRETIFWSEYTGEE